VPGRSLLRKEREGERKGKRVLFKSVRGRKDHLKERGGEVLQYINTILPKKKKERGRGNFPSPSSAAQEGEKKKGRWVETLRKKRGWGIEMPINL